MRRVIAVLFLVVLAEHASAQDSQDKWARADRETVRLSPSAFPELPQDVRADLDARQCRIPQAFSDDKPHNVLVGAFTASKSRDWVVLCSVDARSTILVYRDGRTTQVDSLGSSTDASYLQGIGDERIGYSLKLEPVDRKYIIAHNAGSPDLPPITHLGINVMFVEKASSVSYFYRGKWRTLAGAD